MSCKGKNHGPNCGCPIGNPIKGRFPTSISGQKEYYSRPATCRKCGQVTAWVASSGRGYLSDGASSGFKRHHCIDPKYNYSPFNKKGQPKLRNRKTKFERDGYIPLIVRSVEISVAGTIVIGEELSSSKPIGLGIAKELEIDRGCPLAFRVEPKQSDLAKLVYFETSSPEPRTALVHTDCFDELELYKRTNEIS